MFIRWKGKYAYLEQRYLGNEGKVKSKTRYLGKNPLEVLKKMRLWEKRNDLAINLSYGQRKLLEIARALATSLSTGEDDVFLFDEPFAGLFPEMKKIVLDLVRELRQAGKTILLIEHDMGLIREITDYIFVLDSGRLLAEGEPEEVLKKREVIDAYLGD